MKTDQRFSGGGEYSAPKIEVIRVDVERGFAGSGEPGADDNGDPGIIPNSY